MVLTMLTPFFIISFKNPPELTPAWTPINYKCCQIDLIDKILVNPTYYNPKIKTILMVHKQQILQ